MCVRLKDDPRACVRVCVCVCVCVRACVRACVSVCSLWFLLTHLAFSPPFVLTVLHKNKLTHTDLKPENILFIDSEYDIEYSPILVSASF